MTKQGNYLPINTRYPVPDLSKGACTLPENKGWFHLAQEETTHNGFGPGQREARAVCMLACPLLDVCAAYILKAEKPAGAWPGVWGGLTPSNRREIRRRGYRH